MSNDDIGLILLLPVTPGRVQMVTPESVKIDADCGHECWIGEHSLQFHLDKSMKTTTKCLACAGVRTEADLKRLGQQHETRILPQQREQLNNIMGKAETDAFIARNDIQEHL